MGRFIQPQAEKGSQKWIQVLVNEWSAILNSEIKMKLDLPASERIEWRSPLNCDDYAEYRDEAFLKRLGVKLRKLPLREFWPRGGPQWDALGRSTSANLFLVEAKSHIPEMISDLKAENPNSIKTIKDSLKATKDFLNSKSQLEWSNCFYQYTNRLAHLYLLRKNGLRAYLVFVYFVNDLEMKGPKTASEWERAVELVHSCLGIGRHKLSKFIAELFIDVERIPT